MMTSREGKLILPDGGTLVEGTGRWEWVDSDTIRLVDATVQYNVPEMQEKRDALTKIIEI